MPKMKTNSGAKKRFALTGTGKIKRKHAFKSHILTKKTKKQKRNLTHMGTVNTVDVNNVKALLGNEISFGDFIKFFLQKKSSFKFY